MLELLALNAHTCTTMAGAVAWFTASADAGTPPDIVFMDMQLADPQQVSCAPFSETLSPRFLTA